jgi:nitrite reductase/ring-hydroxylating ferredoxin subunit
VSAPEPAAAPGAGELDVAAGEDAAAPSGFAVVARLDELPPGTLLGVVTPDGRRVCLVNVDGDVRALRDECTHQAFPLSAGELLPDGTVQCAWHGARFDACSGCVCAGPAVEPVARYAVAVVGGVIHVGPELDDGPTTPDAQ